MAKRKGQKAESYRHDEATRAHIPESGNVDYVPKRKPEKAEFGYDPRLSPQLVWAGKAGLRRVEVEEEASLEVPDVSLHIHERVSTEAVLRAVRREDAQRSLFADPELEFSQDVQYYQHQVGWSNRMILGDSLLVMNSLLQREGMRGQVQCIYMDPPYGIKYASNFQPRIDQRDVKDGKDEDLTREVMQVQAFRDTWELGVHSYLTYLRDRLLLARELLADSGSIFVQIGDENVHRVRCLMDEVFGEENFVAQVTFQKTGLSDEGLVPKTVDYILFFARDRSRLKYRQLYLERRSGTVSHDRYDLVLTKDGILVPSSDAREDAAELAQLTSLRSARSAGTGDVKSIELFGRSFSPGAGTFKTDKSGLNRLAVAGRARPAGNTLRYLRKLSDFPVTQVHDRWESVQVGTSLEYVVQTAQKVIERCLLMTTDPGDLVLDPTCGSGTTAYVAEQWGGRWITMDTSRVALAIARHRLMTAAFDYYKLRHPTSGVSGGFVYKTVPHITLKSIAQNTEIDAIAAEFQPQIAEALDNLNRTHRPNDQEPWKEWEVPRLTSEEEEYAKKLRAEGKIGSYADARLLEHLRFWELKREMQARVDASIARNAPVEELVDQPEKERGIVRVSGPFTVEAVPNVNSEFGIEVESYVTPSPSAMERGSGGEADEHADHIPGLAVNIFTPLEPHAAENASAYVSDMVAKLRKTGVVAKGNKRLTFSSLREVGHPVLHAEGELQNGETRRVGVMVGPRNGSVSEAHMREALHAGKRYDVVLVCGFEFTPSAQEMANLATSDDWQILLAHISPDTVMGDLLKDTKASQLFTMVGEPDLVVYRHGDPDLQALVEQATQRGQTDVAKRAATLGEGEIFIELKGVDVYDPVTNEVRSDSGDSVHAVFIDQDYDGKSFCVCQALFPNKRDSWAKIARNLKGTLDEDAFEAFRTLVSLPFKPGGTGGSEGRVHVKVIDQRGNAVVKTVRV